MGPGLPRDDTFFNAWSCRAKWRQQNRFSSVQPARRRAVAAAGFAPFAPAGDELAGMVVRHFPGAVLAHEEIAGGQRAAVELLLAQHQREFAIEIDALV